MYLYFMKVMLKCVRREEKGREEDRKGDGEEEHTRAAMCNKTNTPMKLLRLTKGKEEEGSVCCTVVIASSMLLRLPSPPLPLSPSPLTSPNIHFYFL